MLTTSSLLILNILNSRCFVLNLVLNIGYCICIEFCIVLNIVFVLNLIFTLKFVSKDLEFPRNSQKPRNFCTILFYSPDRWPKKFFRFFHFFHNKEWYSNRKKKEHNIFFLLNSLENYFHPISIDFYDSLSRPRNNRQIIK